MKLDEVPGGAIYVDTNIFYMYLRADPAHLSTLTTFFTRVVRGGFEAFVGVPVLDELYYRLLLARVKDATSGNPLDVLRADLPGTLRTHSESIDTALRKLVALPHLHLVGVETADFDGMRMGLTKVASDDTDFDRVATITRHWVINPPAGS